MSSLKLYGSTSGYVEIVPQAAAGNNSVTLPNTAGSIAVKDASGNLEVGTGVTVSAPSSNTFTVSTNGSERIRIDSSGRLAVGTTSPGSYETSADNLVVADSGNGGITIVTGTSSYGSIYFADGTTSADKYRGVLEYNHSNNAMAFWTDATERARIDSSGRLLIGTSSSPTTGQGQYARIVAQGYNGDATGGGIISIQRGSAATGSGSALGQISFGDNTGATFATIDCAADGTVSSASDLPGRLVFSTTADGASSPTERMRITEKGCIHQNFANIRSASEGFSQWAAWASNLPAIEFYGSSGSYSDCIINSITARSASNVFSFFRGWSGNTADREFDLYGDGNGKCDGSWTGGGADYAEYFEWSDGNPDEDDRRGISVVLDGDQIRPAVDGEDPIGVISGNPSVVGDAAWNKWNGKYLRDDFGTYIQEDYEVEDEEGNTVIQQRRKLNPNYNPDQEYINREQRPEWDCVGLMGKLRIRKGQPTGSRWIKMRDVSDSVEEWLVR